MCVTELCNEREGFVSLQTNEKSLQPSTVSDPRDVKSSSQPTQNPAPRDGNLSTAEQRAGASQLVEYLQRRTKLQMSGGAEMELNSHECSQRTVLLTTTLKLVGNCVDDVISWAKAIPGETIDFHDTDFLIDYVTALAGCCNLGL